MDTSQLKFGEREEVMHWAEHLDHDLMCRILAPQFDRDSTISDDWRSYFTDDELRGFVVDHVMLVANVPA